MSISTGGTPRNVKNLPFTNGTREWSNGLFDCFGDCGTCVHAWFCPCMVYSKNKHRVEYLNQNGRPDPDSGGSGVDGDCAMHCCLTVLFNGGFILQMPNRGAIRNRYNIEGSTWMDCLTSFYCKPCVLTQESREIGLEEQSLMG
ncbi:PLAC8 family domain containing protein [Amanita muscaria]